MERNSEMCLVLSTRWAVPGSILARLPYVDPRYYLDFSASFVAAASQFV